MGWLSTMSMLPLPAALLSSSTIRSNFMHCLYASSARQPYQAYSSSTSNHLIKGDIIIQRAQKLLYTWLSKNPALAAFIMRSADCQFFLPCGARPKVVGLKCTLSFGDTWPIFQISVDVIVQGHTKPPKLGPSCVSTIGMSPAHSRLCPCSLRATAHCAKACCLKKNPGRIC